ncbi:MAG: TIGR02530 family flagellar biosynthesis protein [Anaerolineae bacterium]
MDRATLAIDPSSQAGSVAPAPRPSRPQSVEGATFGQVLERETSKAGALRFSKHAQARLQQRGVTLDAQGLERLEGAVEEAASKGARDSLVLMDDLALIVSVRNRTVVTAVDAASRKGGVFTNIDSVVLAK